MKQKQNNEEHKWMRAQSISSLNKLKAQSNINAHVINTHIIHNSILSCDTKLAQKSKN